MKKDKLNFEFIVEMYYMIKDVDDLKECFYIIWRKIDITILMSGIMEVLIPINRALTFKESINDVLQRFKDYVKKNCTVKGELVDKREMAVRLKKLYKELTNKGKK